ncbi:hypothetical protein BDZ45DRAFT_696043 [Acephala macrosclerotiorum]|nr:hypothetical protein BDZ45DRAFT_696043 [Acephala macrosclerotiorum]
MQILSYCFTVLAVAASVAETITPKRQVSETITAAANSWRNDTGTVSAFLDYAVSLLPNSPSDFLEHAATALAAELDELTHKAVLDKFFLLNTTQPNHAVSDADSILVTDGTFQYVVDSLTDISKTGRLVNVLSINAVRCTYVLPAIDTYLEQVAISIACADLCLLKKVRTL